MTARICPDCQGQKTVDCCRKVRLGPGCGYEDWTIETCQGCDGTGEVDADDDAVLR